MKIPRPTDRRVLRTRAALRNALLSLIVERGWDAIGIADVCERAAVGRSTFYTHFADKEELLLGGFDDLRRMLRGSREPAKVLGFTGGLLKHVEENKRMFRALIGKRASQVAQRRLLQLVIELIHEDLSPLLPPDRLALTVHYLAGALVEVLVWWVDSRSPLPRDEIDAFFHQLAGPALSPPPRRTIARPDR